ncbi:epididymal secretory protein E1-like isoform X2 [Varroa destructor]|uniref:MD-2-related lipid-recognition domain-containing protein n=1 Tax=Varroa destructor TaxID=109461 RepID=A0A7M7MDS3_VARDE|nr:epididymal secretory protein E1-like isoform X2 [Varroa destructor]
MMLLDLFTVVFAVMLMMNENNAKQLDSYVNCGGTGHIENITVVPCESEPCEFAKGSKVNVHFIGSFSHDANSVRVQPSVIVDKMNVTLTGVDQELCGKHVQCPIKANELRDAEIEIPIFNVYPNQEQKWVLRK